MLTSGLFAVTEDFVEFPSYLTIYKENAYAERYELVIRGWLCGLDNDFGDLAFQFGLPATCGDVLFRLQANSSAALAIMFVVAIHQVRALK